MCVAYTELARFLTYVRSVTEAIEKASGVPVPDYVKLRWESRSKGTIYQPPSSPLNRPQSPFSFLSAVVFFMCAVRGSLSLAV